MLKTKVVEKIETHFKFNLFLFFFFRKSCRNYFMWENNVQTDRPQMTIWRMRIACRIPKAIDTHSVYAILTAFPLQQLLHERASILRYTYTASLVNFTSGTAVQQTTWYQVLSRVCEPKEINSSTVFKYGQQKPNFKCTALNLIAWNPAEDKLE
jgi:hypothetical protein